MRNASVLERLFDLLSLAHDGSTTAKSSSIADSSGSRLPTMSESVLGNNT